MVNTIWLYFLSYLLGAVAICLLAIWNSHIWLLYICTTIAGFFFAAYGPILTEVTCIIMGAENFSLAYSYLMVFMALGLMTGGPVTGTKSIINLQSGIHSGFPCMYLLLRSPPTYSYFWFSFPFSGSQIVGKLDIILSNFNVLHVLDCSVDGDACITMHLNKYIISGNTAFP